MGEVEAGAEVLKDLSVVLAAGDPRVGRKIDKGLKR
jgi:hypothetical protein